MNLLPRAHQLRVLAALVDGCSIRATERMTGVHRDTIMRLGARIGHACANLHHERVHSLNVTAIEADEIWSFVGKKQRKLTDADSPEMGDTYTFIGLDAVRKLIVSTVTGKRDGVSAATFALDLRYRIRNRPQITTDGFSPYVAAIEAAFGADVDYAQLIKEYESVEQPGRYAPGRVVSSETKVVTGKPRDARICTSMIERQNLTVRMQVRRFTRLTNAYSKDAGNHSAAVSLYVGWYNWCRVHDALKVTPAMEAGLTDHVWDLGELMDAALAAPEAGPVLPPPTPVGASAGAVRIAQSKRNKRRRNKEHIRHPARPVKARETAVPWLTVIDGGKAA